MDGCPEYRCEESKASGRAAEIDEGGNESVHPNTFPGIEGQTAGLAKMPVPIRMGREVLFCFDAIGAEERFIV
jgi:hypothetical protein